MKVKTKKYLLFLLYTYLIIGCKTASSPTKVFERWAHDDFAFGDDISFVPNMEIIMLNGLIKMEMKKISSKF